VSNDLPLVFAVHPRTWKKLEKFDLLPSLSRSAGEGRGESVRIHLTEPLGYIQFMKLGPLRPCRDHGLRRRAGREHLSGDPVPDAA
jgi:hypothetical protein